MPRNYPKIDYKTASKVAYNRFCALHPSIQTSFEDFKKITYAYNYALRDYALETGEKIRLPFGVGHIVISKKKIKKIKTFEGKEYINMPIDWVKTKAAGKKIYLLNSHTDGYRYKWYWFTNESKLYQSGVRFFKPCRDTSRKLAAYLKQPNSKYAQLYKEWDSTNFRYKA